MDRNRLNELIARYKDGTLTQEEKALLDTWYLQLSQQPEPSISERDLQHRLDVIWGDLEINRVQRSRYRRFTAYFSVAALLVMGLGFYFNKSNKEGMAKEISQTDILPATNKATLTLPNGGKVALSGQQDGIVVGNKTVTYYDGTMISHAAVDSVQITADTKLSLTTPKGGKYRVILSDGTKVWLNAVSTLTYPAEFTGDRREVEIVGEAYFEVVNTPLPFIVKTRGQEVTVLGTEFNINAYAVEAVVKTTLVNGAIRVDARDETLYLEPGEQAVSGHTTLHKMKADMDVAISWKSELFVFKDEPLPSILLQLSRWYDIEVDYDGVSNMKLDGEIPRTFTLEEVIRSLEAGSDIKFSLNERRLTVK